MDKILLVPGLHDSGPDHWQSRWHLHFPHWQRMRGLPWDKPNLTVWSAKLASKLKSRRGRVHLVAHSFGALTAIAAARLQPHKIASILLVAPADPTRFGIADERLAGPLLVTVHRRENWGDEVAGICRAIARLATANPDMRVLFPVHLNPVIKQAVYPLLGHLPNVTLTEPLDYLAMQQAIADAWLVMTDSGGLQEEAPTYGVPLLVLREETERPEAVESGYAQLMGTDEERIVQRVSELWQVGDFAPRVMANPFGDGQACARIVAIMADALLR